MTMSPRPSWKQKILDEVEVRLDEPPSEVELSRALAFAASAAARARGIPLRPYLRRCVVAMVAHDLGMTYPEALALDPRVLSAGPPDVSGRLYGVFEIERLAGEADA
jgi:hypothetical protein